MSHQVRTHTRTVNGKTVTVRRHNAADPDAQAAKDQRKRDAFERRVLAERQRAASPDAYSGTPRRTPGQRRSRKKSGWTRAKSHARKAKRLWRRHKTRAVAHGLLALGWAGGHAARRSAAKARKTCRQWRKRRSK